MKTSQAFEVVRASAGSGKTYRLVTRYLACCLKTGPEGFKPEAFRHVLALTFTNKAAGEMKGISLRRVGRFGGVAAVGR